MPTYDYQCKECGHTFEHFQAMSAPLLTACPNCNGALKRLIGAGAGLIFKGSGFYVNDYKKKDGGNGDSKHSESKTPAATETAKSGETKKTETTAEPKK